MVCITQLMGDSGYLIKWTIKTAQHTWLFWCWDAHTKCTAAFTIPRFSINSVLIEGGLDKVRQIRREETEIVDNKVLNSWPAKHAVVITYWGEQVPPGESIFPKSIGFSFQVFSKIWQWSLHSAYLCIECITINAGCIERRMEGILATTPLIEDIKKSFYTIHAGD